MKRLFSIHKTQNATDVSLLLLRVVASSFMLTHGLKKLAKYSDPEPLKFSDPLGISVSASLGLAVFAEFGCSILLILGLATRLSTIPLIITMLIIVFISHANDGFGKQELPLMYLLVYSVILISGPGKYSVDQVISSKA
jgi:putative oxidoreductase